MKKRILLLCSISLISFSLVGCNKKLKIDKAEKTIEQAIEDTNKKLKDINNDKETHFEFDLDIQYYSISSYSEIESSFYIEGQGNLNLDKLRNEQPDASDSEFYIYSKNYEKSRLTNSGISGPGHYETIEENTLSLKDNYYKEYTKTSSSEYGAEFLVDEYISENIANEALSILDQLANLDDYENGTYYEYQNILLFQAKIMEFLNEKITSRELVSYLEGMEIIPNTPDNKWIISLLDVVQDVNPKDYFSYTKSSKIINAKFDYDNWHNSFISSYNVAKVNGKFIDYEEEVKTVVDALPISLELTYSINLSKKNYISSFEAYVKAVGPKVESIPLYDMELSVNANLNLTNQKVIVKTPNIPDNVLIRINQELADEINKAYLDGNPLSYEELTSKLGNPIFEYYEFETYKVIWASGCNTMNDLLKKIDKGQNVPIVLVSFEDNYAILATYVI